MVAINIANLGACLYYFRHSSRGPNAHETYLRSMRIMGLIFTLVALYRAIFVSRYLYQYGWFDTIANSSLLIRGMAWAAELSFSGLIAMAMLRFNADMCYPSSGSPRLVSLYTRRAPYVLVACIFTAQFFATAGLITKSRMAFAIEESLWSAGFLSILPLAFLQFRTIFFSSQIRDSTLSMLKAFAAVNFAWCVIYCTYGVVYHLPTEYWATAFEQLETGMPAVKTGVGAVKDALTIVNVTHDYNDWGFGFVLWHSAYFSVCVWLAIFLMRGPRKLPD